MSGGGGQRQVTQESGPPKWMRPYWQNMLNAGQGLVDRPYQISPVQGVSGLTPEQLAAQQMITSRALQGNQLIPQAESELGRTMSGQYLNSNPYIDASVNRAMRGITDQYRTSTLPSTMAQFQRSGAFGGSAHQEALARQEQGLGQALGDTASQMYGANYAQERQNQLAAAGMADRYANADYQDAMALMNVGDQRQQQLQNELNYQQQQWQNAWNYPQQQLGWYGSLLSGQPYQTQTGPNPNYTSRGQGVLGGAMSGAALGSMVPGIGTGIGALVGGGLGLFGG